MKVSIGPPFGEYMHSNHWTLYAKLPLGTFLKLKVMGTLTQ